jgi:hypothetical protein
VRYKFEAMYELGSLAVVNVRDMSSVKTAFKLLAFPDTRVFQCTNNQSKVRPSSSQTVIIERNKNSKLSIIITRIICIGNKKKTPGL